MFLRPDRAYSVQTKRRQGRRRRRRDRRGVQYASNKLGHMSSYHVLRGKYKWPRSKAEQKAFLRTLCLCLHLSPTSLQELCVFDATNHTLSDSRSPKASMALHMSRCTYETMRRARERSSKTSSALHTLNRLLQKVTKLIEPLAPVPPLEKVISDHEC